MLRQLLQVAGKKLRKNGLHETTWYTFGAAAATAVLGNTVFSQISVNGLNVSTITDIVSGGLAAAGFYELSNVVIPKLLAWLEKKFKK